MKRYHFGKNLLLKSVALCCGVICFAATSQAESKKPAAPQSNEGESTFTVNRKPSVGSGIDVRLLVDGKSVRTLMKGSRYKGTLSPGKHVISVMPVPNTSSQQQDKVEFTAEKGHNYSFSVAYDKSGRLVLQKNP